jgi:hypothetical protein
LLENASSKPPQVVLSARHAQLFAKSADGLCRDTLKCQAVSFALLVIPKEQ